MKKKTHFIMILLIAVIAGCDDKPATITAKEDALVVHICATKSDGFSKYINMGVGVDMKLHKECENKMREVLKMAKGNTAEQHTKRKDLLENIRHVGHRIVTNESDCRYYTCSEEAQKIPTTKLFSSYLK